MDAGGRRGKPKDSSSNGGESNVGEPCPDQEPEGLRLTPQGSRMAHGPPVGQPWLTGTVTKAWHLAAERHTQAYKFLWFPTQDCNVSSVSVVPLLRQGRTQRPQHLICTPVIACRGKAHKQLR